METYKYQAMKADEEEAKAAYNELVRLGARPSRPIREEFAYHTWNYKRGDSQHEGKFEWYDSENDALGHADEASLMPHHWLIERRLFEGQLRRWREFRKAQQTSKGDPNLRDSLLVRPSEMSALESADPVLTQKLTTIQDWRAYRAYFQGKVARLDSRRMAARDQVSHSTFTLLRTLDLPKKDKMKAELKKNVIQFSAHHQIWQAEKALLGRVDAEILKILNETVHELSVHDPALLIQYQEHTAKIAQYLAERLGTLSSSTWPLRSPPASLSVLDKLYQWEREISRLSDLYQEWKENLECIQMSHNLDDGNTIYLLSPEPSVIRDRSLWERHVQSRQQQVVNAEKWQRCWKDVEDFCTKEGAAHLGNFLPTDYLETTRKEQGLAYVSIQEATQALKNAEQEAAEALSSLNQPKELSKCPWETPSTRVDTKIVRKRKADDETPMEPQAKRICLPRKVSATVKLQSPQRHPVRRATPTSINSTSKCERSALPTIKASPSTAVKLQNDELLWDRSVADNADVPQRQLVPSATPTSANSAPLSTKRARSASSAPNPSSSTAYSTENEGPQFETKKTPRGKKATQPSKNGKGATAKPNKEKGKTLVTKTGRVTKPRDYRAEAKANGGVRRSERIKEMKKNLRCREGCTEMHEHLY